MALSTDKIRLTTTTTTTTTSTTSTTTTTATTATYYYYNNNNNYYYYYYYHHDYCYYYYDDYCYYCCCCCYYYCYYHHPDWALHKTLWTSSPNFLPRAAWHWTWEAHKKDQVHWIAIRRNWRSSRKMYGRSLSLAKDWGEHWMCVSTRLVFSSCSHAWVCHSLAIQPLEQEQKRRRRKLREISKEPSVRWRERPVEFCMMF